MSLKQTAEQIIKDYLSRLKEQGLTIKQIEALDPPSNHMVVIKVDGVSGVFEFEPDCSLGFALDIIYKS